VRNILEKPDKVTQGTIFSNAKSCYLSKDVFGLIISGRCDIENAHYQTFLYLPVIDMKTWFYTFVQPKVSIKKANDMQYAIKKEFSEKGLTMEPLKYADKDKIISEHFKEPVQRKINGYYEKHEFYNKMALDRTCTPSLINQLEEKEKRGYIDEVENLLKNDCNGFFYLENVNYYEQEREQINHFVIILNEVQTLPLEAVDCLCNGIDLSNPDYQSLS
jgi:hypothetical protein